MTTANLHTRKTAKQMAADAGVSVRSIYDAMKLRATGRVDLCEKVRAGDMSIHGALIAAGVKQSPGNKSLFAAWRRASDAERKAFIEWLSATGAA